MGDGQRTASPGGRGGPAPSGSGAASAVETPAKYSREAALGHCGRFWEQSGRCSDAASVALLEEALAEITARRLPSWSQVLARLAVPFSLLDAVGAMGAAATGETR